MGTAKPRKPVSRPFGLVTQPLELPARPADDIDIDPLAGRAHLRPIEVAVVVDPAFDIRVVRLGQINIPKRVVWKAFKRVKANGERVGADLAWLGVRDGKPNYLHDLITGAGRRIAAQLQSWLESCGMGETG